MTERDEAICRAVLEAAAKMCREKFADPAWNGLIRNAAEACANDIRVLDLATLALPEEAVKLTEVPLPDEPAEILAGRLIDAWCADKGKQIPWAKAVQIVAIVMKQTPEDEDRLLKMWDEDGRCEMCGRSDAAMKGGS